MANGKTITPSDEICQVLTQSQAQYKAALPPQIPSDRFIRIAQTAIRTTPKLASPDMDRNSLYAALLRCAQTGLLPDGREAAIVPWGKTARFMPMVAGMLRLARNSGEIKSISAQVVYEKDTYEAWEDETGQHFKFKKFMEDADRGKRILTYAYCITKDGALYYEEIAEADMLKIKAMSKADDSPWKGPFEDEMRKKSAIRRLLKHRVPSSTDLDDVIRADDEMYTTPVPDKPVPGPKPTTSSRLRDAVETTAVPAQATAAAATEPPPETDQNECIKDSTLPI